MGDLEETADDIDGALMAEERSEGVFDNLEILVGSITVEPGKFLQIPFGSCCPTENPVVTEEELIRPFAAEDNGVPCLDLSCHPEEKNLIGYRKGLSAIDDHLLACGNEFLDGRENFGVAAVECSSRRAGVIEFVAGFETNGPGVGFFCKTRDDGAIKASAEITPHRNIGNATVDYR